MRANRRTSRRRSSRSTPPTTSTRRSLSIRSSSSSLALLVEAAVALGATTGAEVVVTTDLPRVPRREEHRVATSEEVSQEDLEAYEELYEGLDDFAVSDLPAQYDPSQLDPYREQEVAEELARTGTQLEQVRGAIAQRVGMPTFTPDISISSKRQREMMALPSSPSHLDLSLTSATSSPKSPSSLLVGSATSEAVMTSPIAVSSPVDATAILKLSLVYLEGVVKQVIETVTAGRGTFESVKPFLEIGLNGVKIVGDTQCVERCSEAITRLEAQLRSLEALKCIDIQAQVASTFAEIQVEEVARREAIKRDLIEREHHVAQLQERNVQRQKELALSNTYLDALRLKITNAEVELNRLRTQFARKEAIVRELNVSNARTLLDYHKEINALEEARKEAAAAVMLTEDELRKKAEGIVRSDHEKKLSDIKFQLASFNLMT